MITASRYHDVCIGHRVAGHESKCQHLHGHNYRITFTLAPLEGLDKVGRVLDFSVIKDCLCQWLETEWDHMFLLWEHDPYLKDEMTRQVLLNKLTGVVLVPFNPTAENMAEYLLMVVCPKQLEGTGAKAVSVLVEETRKCSTQATL
jgi:6-pyruvoyltetrahydropterin/6-carboxytetrahydropterin synthase